MQKFEIIIGIFKMKLTYEKNYHILIIYTELSF